MELLVVDPRPDPPPRPGDRIHCPRCLSEDVQVRTSKPGEIKANFLACQDCGHSWKVAGTIRRILVLT